MAKHKKKKNVKNAGNVKAQQNIKKKAQRKSAIAAKTVKTENIEKIGRIEKREKSEKRENTTAVLEKTEVIKPETVAEIAAIQNEKRAEIAQNPPKKEKTEILRILREKFSSGGRRRERAAQQWERFSGFVMETRRVSIPVIIIVYTVLIASAALIIDNSYNKRRLEVEEKRLIEEMANARAHSADIILEKDVPLAAGECGNVTYCGYSFTDRVAAQNSEKYAACYENTSEANTYLDIVLSYENALGSAIRADAVCAMTVNDGRRDYPCFAAAETDGGRNIEFASGQTVEAGAAARIHYIFDVPKELERSEGTISAKAIIDNVEYVINLRE